MCLDLFGEFSLCFIDLSAVVNYAALITLNYFVTILDMREGKSLFHLHFPNSLDHGSPTFQGS